MVDLDFLQWPAMAVTLAAAWFTASQSKHQRKWGFWLFLVSNVLWIGWGWTTAAWALVVLQLGLAAMNIRGSLTNDDEAEPEQGDSLEKKAGA